MLVLKNITKHDFCVLFLLTILICHVSSVFAVSAYPGWVKVCQPNGDTIRVQLYGNEDLKWAMTEDGYTLLCNTDGYFSYAIKDSNGDLVASKVIATGSQGNSLQAKRLLPGIERNMFFSDAQLNSCASAAKASAPSASMIQSMPSVGKMKVLMILVQFSDVQFQHTQSDFYNLANQEGYNVDGCKGSVRDFYLENSFGKLDLITDVTKIYTLSQTRAYYGQNGTDGHDLRTHEMASEAIRMAAQDYNMAEYDNDGDGYVDGIHIIYAGADESAGGGNDCVWAHSSYEYVKSNGVSSARYSCSSELRDQGQTSNICFIGTICHELGHVLGCKDYYDTDYSVNNQYCGTGMWDLMGQGNWNADGACPAHFNPYVKIYEFGWASAQSVSKACSVTLNGKKENAFLRIDTKTSGEFFLLEYRAQTGFDASIPGHGLMIYRSSGGMSRMSDNTLNAMHEQQFYPLCANASSTIPTSSPSSYGTVNSASAPFPGTLGKTDVTDDTAPSLTDWNGSNTGCPITNITEDVSNELVIFDVKGGAFDDICNFKVTATDETSVTMTWNNTKPSKVLLAYSSTSTFGTPIGANPSSLIDGGGTVVYIGTGSTYKQSDLTTNTQYYFKLFAQKDDGTWTTVSLLQAMTEAGVIRSFPYKENFSAGKMPEGYRNDHLYSEVDWTVGYFNDPYCSGSNYALKIGTVSTNQAYLYTQKTRLRLPKFDLGGKSRAMLSFVFRNYMQGPVTVAYRTSTEDNWHTIYSIYDSNFQISERYYINPSSDCRPHLVSIPLKKLTSTYELCFISNHNGNNETSSSEVCYIKDISLDVDYKVHVETPLQYTILTNGTVKMSPSVYEGEQTVSSYGISVTISGVSKNFTANESGEVFVSGLSNSSSYTYRAFAVSADGTIIYGDSRTMRYTALSFSSGDGTPESPYIIKTNSDLTNLLTYTRNGNDFTGENFALGNNVQLIGSAGSTFNGTLDGCGYKITVSKGQQSLLFKALKPNAVIKNLTIYVEEANTCDVIADCNAGTITDCDVTVLNRNRSVWRLSAYVCDNYGLISRSKAYLVSTSYKPTDSSYSNREDACGFALYNEGLITGCTFDGHLQGRDNADLGGIASINYYQQNQDSKKIGGIITDCVNLGTLEVVNAQDKTWMDEVGGIVGSNYGHVLRCINKGKISGIAIGSSSSYPVNIGGIVGESQYGIVSDCLNLGTIEGEDDDDALNAGGIAGMTRLAVLRNSYSNGSVTVTNYTNSRHNAIAGQNDQSFMASCYYSGSNLSDSYATKDDDVASVLSHFQKTSSSTPWTITDNELNLKWNTGQYSSVYKPILRISPSSLQFEWQADGNLNKCYLQVRKHGEQNWDTYPGENGKLNITEVNDLEPVTIYDMRIMGETYLGDNDVLDVDSVSTFFITDGTKENPHIIADKNTLMAFSNLVSHGVNFNTQLIQLTTDIDLCGNGGQLWEPIRSDYIYDGLFGGEFDGGGHVIDNMRIETTRNDVGFFGRSMGYVHDMTLRNAKITVKSASSTGVENIWHNTYICGVGGIVGNSSTFYSIYPYLIERCGFEGTITGGQLIGGILGTIPKLNAVNDCYANAVISTDATSATIGGIVGEGNASNCYFVGNIQTPDIPTVIVSPIAGTYYSNGVNSNCYYYATAIGRSFSLRSDQQLSQMTMKDGTLESKLTQNIWTRVSYLNEGYPVLSITGVSRVITQSAEVDEQNRIVLRGFYVAGTSRACSKVGFEYMVSDNNNRVYHIDAGNVADNFSGACIDASQLDGNISFRAYATDDIDTLWGDWMRYNAYATSIQHVYVSETTISDNKIYTIQGKLLYSGKNVQDAMRLLPAGIYIINRKKIIISK